MYLITFACYGCQMRGCESGSVDRAHDVPRTPILEGGFHARRSRDGTYRSGSYHYGSDQARKRFKKCAHRGWSLAAHVRRNHVHAVVEAEVPPERVMNDSNLTAAAA